MSTAVVAVRAHPDKHEKAFDAAVTFLTQYIDKRAPTHSVKVASVGQSRPAKRQKTSTTHGTFKGKIELNKYFRSYMSFGRKPGSVRRPQKAPEL